MNKTSHTIERKPLCPGGRFTAISDARFKTGRISACFLLPLQEETAAANAIVPYLLRRACAAYPDFMKLNERLAELYGASLHAEVQKIGEVQCIALSASSLDDRYTLDGDEIAGELSELMCKMLLEPAFDGEGAFRREDFEQEQRQLTERIEAEQSDKRSYAKKRCEEEMCADEAFGISRYGTPEEVAALTPERAKEAWEQMLRRGRIEVFALTSGNPEQVYDTFSRYFSSIERGETALCETLVVESSEDVTEVGERMDITQAKLVLGFRAGIAEPDDDVMSARMMTAIWGGTPHSKLFLNVRERLSLCYYCAARYDRNKGIILVECGIEKQNKQAAQDEILRQLELIKNGEFTAEELDQAKLSVTNSFQTLTDAPYGLVVWMINQCLDREVMTVEEAVEQTRAIRREQVIAAARRVTLDTVYFLSEGEERA